MSDSELNKSALGISYSNGVGKSRLSPILRLFFSCRPSAIVRFVVAKVIYAFNGIFRRRLWSHILEELFKAVPPARTHCYATASITVKVRSIMVKTSLFHASPGSVFRSHVSFAAMPSFPVLGYYVSLQATTRSVFPGNKVKRSSETLLPTDTFALPNKAISFARSHSNKGNCCKSPEHLIRDYPNRLFSHGLTMADNLMPVNNIVWMT